MKNLSPTERNQINPLYLLNLIKFIYTNPSEKYGDTLPPHPPPLPSCSWKLNLKKNLFNLAKSMHQSKSFMQQLKTNLQLPWGVHPLTQPPACPAHSPCLQNNVRRPCPYPPPHPMLSWWLQGCLDTVWNQNKLIWTGVNKKWSRVKRGNYEPIKGHHVTSFGSITT